VAGGSDRRGAGDPQVGMAVALFYFTGQRINEVVKMSWRDIEGDHMIVFVQKNGSKRLASRSCPSWRRCWEAEERPRAHDPDQRQRAAVDAIGLRQKLQAWAKASRAQGRSARLRKNAVNSLFEAGCTAAEVSGITDQSIGMLEHYAKGRNKLKLGRAAIIKLDAARKGGTMRESANLCENRLLSHALKCCGSAVNENRRSRRRLVFRPPDIAYATRIPAPN
jgi:hypothetical protein